MDQCTVYFFEAGFPDTIPGFKKNIPAASFPFWGNYYFLDFALANFQALNTENFYILADNRYRGLFSFITSRWEAETSKLIFLDEGMSRFIKLLQNEASETVIITSLSIVSIIEQDTLLSLIDNKTADIVKLSLNSITIPG